MANLLNELAFLPSDPFRVMYAVQRLRIGCLMALNNDRFNPVADATIIRTMMTTLQKELSIALRLKKRGLDVFVNAHGCLMKMMKFIEIHMEFDKNYKPSDDEDKEDEKDVEKIIRMRLLKVNY